MRRTTVIAAALTVLLVAAPVAGAAVGTPSGGPSDAGTDRGAAPVASIPAARDTPTPTPPPEYPGANESVRPADTVYVTDDGDLILVYRDAEADSGTGRLGVNVSAGLVHVLLANETASNVTGALRATLTRQSFVGNGSLAVGRPDALKSLAFSAATVRTAERSRSDVELHATVANESATGTTDYGRLSTAGRLRVTPSRYEFTAGMRVTGSEHVDEPLAYEASVTETRSGYRLRVHRNSTVPSYAKARWDTRENATRTLRMLYNTTAKRLNGTSEVTLRSYEFSNVTNGSYRLDVAYTVEYRGVKETVSDRLTESLASQENLTLTESEASRISETVQNLQVERLAVSLHTGGETSTANVTVRLSGYDDVYEAALDVAAAQENLSADARKQLSEARKKLEARRASGLVRRVTWRGSTSVDDAKATIDFRLRARTQHWQRYVDALDARGITVTHTEYEVTARTEGDRIRSEVSVTVRDDELVAQLLRPSAQSAAPDDAEQVETLRKLRRAGFRRAKMNASLTEGAVTFRAAAHFENLTALQSAFDDAYGARMERLAARYGGGKSVTYVRVTGAVGADPDESTVREQPFVGENTTVKMPGEWDRQFPRMDAESVREYLGYDVATPTGTATGGANANVGNPATGTGGTPTGTSSRTPGFGLVAALLALLAAVAVAVRRRR